MRSIKDYALLSLKGVGMGAADVVPGVSGGTIAFITGIYEELIETISGVNFQTIGLLFSKGPKVFWKAINGNFILALFLGIAISIFSLAKLISFLLESEAIPTWSFFFGLIIGSIPLVARRVHTWTGSRYFAFIAGAIIAWLITDLPPVTEPGSQWYLFLSGSIAICAMILPGISGSFILILLGSYFTILNAVNDRDVQSIGIFMLGCISGLLVFSRFLKFMFKRYHDLTTALLAGFLLGSLNKIWPWKNVLEAVTKHAGEANEKTIPIVEENVLPHNYVDITGEPSQLGLALLMTLIGAALLYFLDRFAAKKSTDA